MTTTPIAERLVATLESLARVAEDGGMRSLARELLDERIPALRSGRMTMVVLGEFNHGKSSIINALLGVDVLPTGITPTTAVITHIIAGNGPARVVRSDSVREIGPDEVRALLTSEQPDDLRYVEIPTQAPLLADGLVVVDTPGVNDISRQKVEVTYGYVPRADVVVYVIDGTQALKRSEVSFIEDRLVRNGLDRLFFVVGKTDALDESELREVLEHVRSRLGAIVGNVPVFPLSARRARQQGDPGFDAFRAAIGAYLRDQRERIVVDGALRAGRRVASLAAEGLAIEEGAFRLTGEELEKRVATARDRLQRSRVALGESVELINRRSGEIAASARDSVQMFAREFAAALPREIDRAATDDIKRYLPDFIHDTFRDFVEDEGAQIAMNLELLAEDVIAITNRNVRDALGDVEKELGVRARNLDLEVNTFGYDVSVLAVGALGVTLLAMSQIVAGALLTIASPVLAFVLKDRVDDVIRKQARAQGLAAIESAAARVSEELDRIVDEFAAKLRRFVEDAGDQLYRQINEVLERVVAERREHVGDTAAPLEQIASLQGRLADVREQLSAAAASLNAEPAGA